MTEKRFIIVADWIWNTGCRKIKDNINNVELNQTEVVNKLNEFAEENEQLKHELHTLTGLYAFDKLGKGVKASDDRIIVPRKDLIKLDYGDVE